MKREEKLGRVKRDQKEEDRRLKEEHAKLMKHYEEKKQKLQLLIA